MNQEIVPGGSTTKNNIAWIWVTLVAIVLLVFGYFGYQYLKNQDEKEASDKAERTTEVVLETWVKGAEIIFENTTSGDTHKISENLFRMFKLGQNGISYVESTDGKNWGAAQKTGIVEEKGFFISNPNVLELGDNDWIMIYEQQPIRQPGQQQGNTSPSAANQRNLYLATSTDGKTFTKVGIAIDSSKEDGYFASVPDLVLLSDGKIRMYYVSGGNAIGSAVSSDKGLTWKRDSGYRLGDGAVDPDVLYKDGKWIMYYSILNQNENALYKATSTDGLVWAKVGKILDEANALVDPDVVEISSDNYIMYYGLSSGAYSTGGETLNLYMATYKGKL
jgi:hypothetical protein